MVPTEFSSSRLIFSYNMDDRGEVKSAKRNKALGAMLKIIIILMKKAVRRGYDCGQGQSAIEIGNLEFGNLFLNYGWWTVILAF